MPSYNISTWIENGECRSLRAYYLSLTKRRDRIRQGCRTWSWALEQLSLKAWGLNVSIMMHERLSLVLAHANTVTKRKIIPNAFHMTHFLRTGQVQITGPCVGDAAIASIISFELEWHCRALKVTVLTYLRASKSNLNQFQLHTRTINAHFHSNTLSVVVNYHSSLIMRYTGMTREIRPWLVRYNILPRLSVKAYHH